MSEDKTKMINLPLADNVGISEVGVLDGKGPTEVSSNVFC
jgi:hypothetical protein